MKHRSRTEMTLPAALHVGTVAAEGAAVAGHVAVDLPAGRFEAEVATGCLVRPEAGDQVSLLIDEEGRPIVLSVLRRPGGGPLTVTTAEGLVLRVAGTSLHLDPRHGAVLASERMVAVAGQTLDIRAERAFADLGSAIWQARSVHALVGRMLTAADSLVVQAGQLLTRAKVSLRSAETLDKTDAPMVEIRGEKGVSIYAENTNLNAGEDVRINGKRVNIG